MNLTSTNTLLRKLHLYSCTRNLSNRRASAVSISRSRSRSRSAHGFVHGSKSPHSLFTTSIDSKVIHDFAAKNADLARKALTPPKINNNINIKIDNKHIGNNNSRTTSRSHILSPPSASTSIDEYLEWRGWEEQFIQHNMTNALLSHALTFPLTLAYHANHFLQDNIHVHLHDNHILSQTQANSVHGDDASASASASDNIDIKLCCVGSRAEADLPDEYWREFLIATNHFHCNSRDLDRDSIHADNYDPARPIKRIRWSIDCIGPELSPHSKTRHIHLHDDEPSVHSCQHTSGDDARAPLEVHSSLTLRYNKGLLHNHILELYKQSSKGNVDDILNSWDGFILFNPGIGHPHLERSWKPTVDFLLKANKRIVTTAHSEVDSERDWKVWEGVYERPPPRYERNPFASKMSFEDPFPTEGDDVARVSPNYSICKF